MINGATRFRHVDRLLGDKATAKLLGAGRFMSCDSVRRNFASMPEDKVLKWVWDENMHLLQDILSEDYMVDLYPTVKPLYGHQEGAEIGYNPQKPRRPSHSYHTLCTARRPHPDLSCSPASPASPASASLLNAEQRRQLIIAWAFRQYGLVRRLFPPLLGDQQTLALA